MESLEASKKLMTVKELAKHLNLSAWSLYENIRTDPTFPLVNIGPKKNYRIDLDLYLKWLKDKSKHDNHHRFRIPTADEILKGIKK